MDGLYYNSFFVTKIHVFICNICLVNLDIELRISNLLFRISFITSRISISFLIRERIKLGDLKCQINNMKFNIKLAFTFNK